MNQLGLNLVFNKKDNKIKHETIMMLTFTENYKKKTPNRRYY